ncbi:hypothetical protein BDGGKGIB_02799 [Nodularia sphaerocarpa UHCC 0038]|nr:hypothetical protein BDGGKGIB_02799 [Nodularia sphaerocarpa UHCC 0038]
MDTNVLKFLLNLLGCPNYRSSLGTNPFNPGISENVRGSLFLISVN